ncbi:metallo-beta-lactamase domain protein [Sporothrix brasiliensis 5110]|uniref:Metallo-beta-lactamase domain protein n=1 Tax=Sporothrix brasiliensis 5110 TaxID=1398154 RepID=A0A0C2EST6_9PEZI|nr:metallo-beta-lactamase domain protein [Sporothrix brasiliensis 5110]KIH89459.1 metallo-beta-lactamase domain protein [Sporothrix brasiliensis 5110]
MAAHDPHATDALLVCTACGTQFPTADRDKLPSCIICDDPRQFTPPTGQAFITMADVRRDYHNVFHPVTSGDDRLTSIVTEPKLAIGQRAVLVRTPAGNILWDCLTLIDELTIAHIRSLGGLLAIVISHPHYYSSHTEWAAAFDCPVYLRAEDREWAVQQSPHQVFWEGDDVQRVPVGDTDEDGTDTAALAIRLGGHFPGSQVLLFDGHLLVADTLVTTPAGRGSWTTDALGAPRTRPAGMNSFAFMWSIPNMIPLSGDEVFAMWAILKHHDFTSTHGAFVGMDIVAADVKQRVLDSMKIQTKFAGWARQDAWASA